MTVSLTFSQSFFEQNVSPTVKIIAIIDVIFESKVTLTEYVILSLTFSQSFFEQNVSVQLKLLRFSAIFFSSKLSQKCGTFWRKYGNAGNKPKCGISRTIARRLTPIYGDASWLLHSCLCRMQSSNTNG